MGRGNSAIGRLLTAMRKMVQEVNDQEICRRLEILMNSEKEDLQASLVRAMLDSPETFDARDVPEPYTQYVKHYLYMVKRARRERTRTDAPAAPATRPRPAGPKKTSARKKAPAKSKSRTKSAPVRK